MHGEEFWQQFFHSSPQSVRTIDHQAITIEHGPLRPFEHNDTHAFLFGLSYFFNKATRDTTLLHEHSISTGSLRIKAQLLVCCPLFVSQQDTTLAIQDPIDDLYTLHFQKLELTDALYTCRCQ